MNEVAGAGRVAVDRPGAEDADVLVRVGDRGADENRVRGAEGEFLPRGASRLDAPGNEGR